MTTGIVHNDNRNQLLNKRIYQRNIPSQVIHQSMDPRMAPTRQVLFPGLDTWKQSATPILSNEGYNQGTQFNPGTKAPYSGYATFVDVESRLHNSFAPTQKYTVLGKFVPSTASDLYRNSVEENLAKQHEQPFPALFTEEQFGPKNVNPMNLGNLAFNNATRQQVKNINPR